MTFRSPSLLLRIFLLVALLLAVSVIIWIQLFQAAEREPRAEQLAQLTASVVNITRAALVNSDPIRRRDMLTELAEREGLRIYLADPDQDVVEPLPARPFFQEFQSQARRLLGRNTRYSLAVNGQPGFWVSFRIGAYDADGGDDYWLMLPRERAERNVAWQWLGWGIGALLLALVAAWLIASRIDRPLRAMALSARAVGEGRRPPPLAENGPEEVRLLARALNQMSRDLTQMEDARAEVLAGISHDLRTPLARLRLAVEMGVEDTGLQSGMVTDLAQMDDIIGQFLDFARGEIQEKEVALDPNQILAAVARRWEERGQPLVLATAPLPPHPLRPRALERAVANLVDNARKYAPGPVELHSSQDKEELHLEVWDQGPGIPPEETERLKRPFTRLENARSNTTGTGLGLAIVERIAKLHGGGLELLPRPGGGLIARLRLPLAAQGAVSQGSGSETAV